MLTFHAFFILFMNLRRLFFTCSTIFNRFIFISLIRFLLQVFIFSNPWPFPFHFALSISSCYLRIWLYHSCLLFSWIFLNIRFVLKYHVSFSPVLKFFPASTFLVSCLQEPLPFTIWISWQMVSSLNFSLSEQCGFIRLHYFSEVLRFCCSVNFKLTPIDLSHWNYLPYNN